MQYRGMIDTRLHEDLLAAINRLEYRLAEAEQEARVCRTALAELRAVQHQAAGNSDHRQ
jgi:hypothetical protein